jgi:hypothetical protein
LRLITAAYRKDDFQDADGYVVQAAMLLERYADRVITEATDPISGIQSHVKFPPSLAELREYCDEVNRRSNYGKNWSEQSRRQLTERLQIEQQYKSPEARAAIMEKMKKELEAYGFKFNTTKSHGETAATVKAKLKISDQDWDKLPDLPDQWKKVSAS